jgi:ribosomal protein S18 acetylase RimI-like enzyme
VELSVTAIPPGTRPTATLRAATERLLGELGAAPENLDALLGDPAARLVVAVTGDEAIVGMLTLTFRTSLTRKSGHVDHVVVDPEHRRRGIASALLEHAAELARSEGASRIDLTSSESRRAAARLYPRCGFEQRETVNWRRRL